MGRAHSKLSTMDANIPTPAPCKIRTLEVKKNPNTSTEKTDFLEKIKNQMVSDYLRATIEVRRPWNNVLKIN